MRILLQNSLVSLTSEEF